jgi:hypothetical protein
LNELGNPQRSAKDQQIDQQYGLRLAAAGQGAFCGLDAGRGRSGSLAGRDWAGRSLPLPESAATVAEYVVNARRYRFPA